MKKLLVFMLIVASFVNCSKNDKSSCNLNPPTWLHGNWRYKIGGTGLTLYDFRISENSIVAYNQGAGRDLCNFGLSESSTPYQEELLNSDSEYAIKIGVKSSQGTQTEELYYFKKVDGSKVKYCPLSDTDDCGNIETSFLLKY